MEIYKDFREFIELLNFHKVEYIIVGGYALAHHGAPRYTGDIDIYINPVQENALRIVKVLKDFSFESLGLKGEDFNKPDKVIQLGFPPLRIDIVTSISGVSWDEALKGVVDGVYDNIPVLYIGRQEFIRNKKACNRKKDQADIEALGEKD